jgi:23S rRNA (adenine2503-C2)-methyltransferase
MVNLYSLLPEELDNLVIRLEHPRYRADQLLHSLYAEFPKKISNLSQIPETMRDSLATAGYTIEIASKVHSLESDDGQTRKVLLKFGDDAMIETVLMQYRPTTEGGNHPRSTVCISTQVGCQMGCVFCATGQMGFKRNLTAAEIVTQVIYFASYLRDRGEHVTNLVFMGMGEPMANYPNTIRAIRILTHPRAFGLGQRSITISTVGVIRGIDNLSDENLKVKLAISLHAPNDELRQELVPTAGIHSVENLISAAKRYFKKTGRRVTFEYALIDEVNDSTEIAEELALLLKGNGAHVNLIPVNSTSGGFRRPARNRVNKFKKILLDKGVNCTVRVEKGSEISAACGQLRTELMKKQGLTRCKDYGKK